MFYKASNLVMNSAFNLPQKITSVSTDFLGGMFRECPNIRMNSVFNLPQQTITAGEKFVYQMFLACSGLTMNSVFTFPPVVNPAASMNLRYFASGMFAGGDSITLGQAFQLPAGMSSGELYLAEGIFSNCTNLTLNSNFKFMTYPNTISHYLQAFYGATGSGPNGRMNRTALSILNNVKPGLARMFSGGTDIWSDWDSIPFGAKL
jgi:hypothetical protein